MRKFIISGFLGVLALTTVYVALADTTIHFERITCGNGFTSAYIATEIDGGGCIFRQWGVNCLNEPWINENSVTGVTSDPGWTYDYYYSGTIGGNTWYAKTKLDSNGGVLKAWGKKANGTYYTFTSL
jgi:hypothetical protein